MQEVWKDIPGYEGMYQVSNLGGVRSLDRITENGLRVSGKVLRQSDDKDGYKKVKLYFNGKQKTYSVHRLVASVFISNPKNYPVINHKNESKADNCVSNLEWCTVKYNNNYGTRTERQSKAQKGKHLSEETKKKISEANSGNKHPMYGKHHTDSTKEKLSELRKGENNPFFGKHHTLEVRQKMKEHSLHISGKDHPMYGKHHKESAKKSMSEKQQGSKNHMYGKIRINNGIENKNVLPEELDFYLNLGYVRGMLSRKCVK